MTNIIVQEGQSIFDLVIQHYGSLDFLVQFCFDNKIGIDTDLTAGQVVVVDETIGVKSVKEFFKLNALSANNRQWKEEVVLSDLDILRQIRDANPDSQLPALWLDSEDPYTQWEGVGWTVDKTRVTTLDIGSRAITALPNINKLKSLTRIQCPANNITSLDLSNMPVLGYVNAGVNNLPAVNLDNTPEIYQLQLWNNRLTDINLTLIQDKLRVLELDHNLLSWVPSLTFKNSGYTYYDFRYNNFPTAELDRFRAMGFTDESRLLPQNP